MIGKLSCIFLFIVSNVLAQSPHGFNYQAIPRTSKGEILALKDVSFKISIIKNVMTSAPVYVEVHHTKTNKSGIVSMIIGEGAFVSSVFENIDWTDGLFFIKVEFDSEGGTEYIDMGTTQLMSVPFAMYADKSGNGISEESQLIKGEKTFASPIKGILHGNVILNNNAAAVAGSIRWTGNDFQGFNGNSWISLTAGGGLVEEDTSNWQCGDILTDNRNGNTYRTILLGSKCWMQDNLNYDSGVGSYAGPGPYAPQLVGRFYDWTGAMDINASYNYVELGSNEVQFKGVCPVDWHLPSHDEFLELEAQPNMNGISFIEGGGSGFEAKLAGFRLSNGTYRNEGIAVAFWTSTESDAENAWKRIVFKGEQGIGAFVFEKVSAFSIRCVRD